MVYLFWGSVVFILIIWACYIVSLRQKRLIDDVPTSKTRGAFIGIVELKGKVQTPTPIFSKITQKPCVYCTWKIQEQWEKWETVPYYDSRSKSWKTRQELRSGWWTHDTGSEMISFYLEDDEGKILVHPSKARIERKSPFFERLPADDPRYHRFSYPAISHTTGWRYFEEQTLDVGEEIYLMGYSRLREDSVELEIAAQRAFPYYLISAFPEEKVSQKEGVSKGCMLFLLLLGVATATFSFTEEKTLMTWAGGFLVYLGLILLGWAYTVQLSLIHLKNMVRQGLSNLDVQLKRRGDLIPRIVEVVQAYVQHEKQVLTLLSHLRAERMEDVSPSFAKNPLWHPCAAKTAMLVEAYPELKSHELFENLQKNLADTEARIALARNYYNNIATAFNTRLAQYPDRWLAKCIGLRPFSLLGSQEYSDKDSAPGKDGAGGKTFP